MSNKLDLVQDENGKNCFVLPFNPLMDSPVFMLSMPKCGTYLMSEILGNIGVVFTKTHISTFNFLDERVVDKQLLKVNPNHYAKPSKFINSLSYIKTGQFAIGHIPRYPETVRMLSAFKKLLIYRPMHNMIISCVKFYSQLIVPRHKNIERVKEFRVLPLNEEKISIWFELWGKEYYSICRDMLAWRNDGVFQISFEDLLIPEKGAKIVGKIQDFLGLTVENTSEILAKALNTDTPTKSPQLSNYKEFWTPKLEKLFIQHGFNQIDIALGYRATKGLV